LGWIVSAAAAELAAGLVLGLGLNAAVAAFTMAGRLVDVQIGFGMGQVWDPATQQHMPVVAAAFTQLALLSFFLLHADHALLRGVALSVQSHPPGTVSQALTDPTNAARLLTQTFSLGFAMVAPVMFVLLLVEFGLGVLARNLPQMNMLVIGVPVKTLVGVAALASFSLAAQGPMARAYTAAFDFVGRAWR
jgi:flagellar biosynthetic protein FliR